MYKRMFFALLLVSAVLGSGLAVAPALASPSTQALTADETAGLLFMFEEEKLARDVYTAFSALWDEPIFARIASSEQTHMEAIQSLLEQYAIPVPGDTAGVYTDPALQALYNELTAAGSASLAEALKAGALIEETDIADLQSRLAATANADIQRVYENLLAGSGRHLRAFVTVLENQSGEIYTPPLLDAAAYETLLSAREGRGRGHGSSGIQGMPGGSRSGDCTGTRTGTDQPDATTRGQGHRGNR